MKTVILVYLFYLYDIDYTAEYGRPTEINKSKKKTLNPKYSAYSLDGL